MVNFTELVYFEDMKDLEKLEEQIKAWTPLKTERRGCTINEKYYPLLKVYWDEDVGMHNWCPNDDWTFPSAASARSHGYTQPDFFKDILPEWERKFEFKRFEPRKIKNKTEAEKDLIIELQKECDPITLDLTSEFHDQEFEALTNAESYILKCGNRTAGGYKECIRDAFCPFVKKFKPSKPLEAIEKYGARKGSFLAMKRVLRCHPFHKGGYDPVPERNEKNEK